MFVKMRREGRVLEAHRGQGRRCRAGARYPVHRHRADTPQRQWEPARRRLRHAYRQRHGALCGVARELEDGDDADERAFPGIRQRGTDHVLWRGRAPNSQDGDRRRESLRRTGRPGCDGHGIVQDLREAGQSDRVIEMYRVSCIREKGVREGGYRIKRADQRFRPVPPRR